jgi:hypothetical protein
MKKKFHDVTYKEYLGWANNRAADGRWSLEMALVPRLRRNGVSV